jgi:hypothetical protein
VRCLAWAPASAGEKARTGRGRVRTAYGRPAGLRGSCRRRRTANASRQASGAGLPGSRTGFSGASGPEGMAADRVIAAL